MLFRRGRKSAARNRPGVEGYVSEDEGRRAARARQAADEAERARAWEEMIEGFRSGARVLAETWSSDGRPFDVVVETPANSVLRRRVGVVLTEAWVLAVHQESLVAVAPDGNLWVGNNELSRRATEADGGAWCQGSGKKTPPGNFGLGRDRWHDGLHSVVERALRDGIPFGYPKAPDASDGRPLYPS